MQRTLKRELKGLETFTREAIVNDSWMLFNQSSIVIRVVVVRVRAILAVLLSSLVAYSMHLSNIHSTSVS